LTHLCVGILKLVSSWIHLGGDKIKEFVLPNLEELYLIFDVVVYTVDLLSYFGNLIRQL
jgi:hypothetical protein